MHCFTDNIEYLVRQRNEQAVRKVWIQFLQGNALIWPSHVLSEADRILPETAAVEGICKKLIDRFNTDPIIARNNLERAQCTLLDMLNGNDLEIYVQIMLRDAKACSFNFEN